MELVSGSSGSVQVPINPTGWTNISPLGGGITGVTPSGGVVSPGAGFLLVYIDNQSIGKEVWFDNLMIGMYKGVVTEESHYYPHGLAIATAEDQNVTKNPHKYQSIELEKHFGLETYETLLRGLDPQLGRFNSIDPKAENHYDVNPYASMGNNPALNVDPMGDDWFVNNKTGGVLFVKNTSKVNQELFNKQNFADKASDYDRFGPDKMFGDKVAVNSYGSDVLQGDFVNIENPEEFMGGRGYAKAEKVTIKEKEFESGGPMGGEERITQTHGELKQIGDAKISYAKPPDMNKKKFFEKSETPGKWGSIKSAAYSLTKPYGQSNNKTAEFSSNRIADHSSAISAGGSLLDLLKGLIPKKK